MLILSDQRRSLLCLGLCQAFTLALGVEVGELFSRITREMRTRSPPQRGIVQQRERRERFRKIGRQFIGDGHRRCDHLQELIFNCTLCLLGPHFEPLIEELGQLECHQLRCPYGTSLCLSSPTCRTLDA